MLAATDDWDVIHPPELASLSEVIWPRSQVLQPRQCFALHAHAWHQLVYASSGALVVTIGQTWYLINPEQAIWIPQNTLHTSGTLTGGHFRSLYIQDIAEQHLPEVTTVFAISPLMRELIIELDRTTHLAIDHGYQQALYALVLAQFQRLDQLDFRLPWPQSPTLQQLCQHLYHHPAEHRTLAEWGAQLGASTRTLRRRFARELGIPLRQWQYLLRMFLAMEWLCQDKSITEIALDLGYASPAAFSYMFRLQTGSSPSQWRDRHNRAA